VPIKVVEGGRWIFLNVGTSSPSVSRMRWPKFRLTHSRHAGQDSSAEWDVGAELKPLEELLEGTQYRKLEYMCTRNYTVKANWKVRRLIGRALLLN
jgi:hypothetical protein